MLETYYISNGNIKALSHGIFVFVLDSNGVYFQVFNYIIPGRRYRLC